MARLPLFSSILAFLIAGAGLTAASPRPYRIEQLTFGPKNHFFGYNGHHQTHPWNGTGEYVVALETSFHDRMPRGYEDAATIILIDTGTKKVIPVGLTHAWNFQQGSMLYWNPENPEEEFFYNDRGLDDRVFTVLYNIASGKRREFIYPDVSIGNGGVAQNGGKFLAFNYGRVFRTVVSYAAAHNFTAGHGHPENDGVWVVDVRTGEPRLIVSYRRIYEHLKDRFPELSRPAVGIYNQLFINHTFWNRTDDRIWFVVRWFREDSALDFYTERFTANPDGSDLKYIPDVLGHPEWERGERMLVGGYTMKGKDGVERRHHVIYDTAALSPVEIINEEFFTRNGEPSLSPDMDWIASVEGAPSGPGARMKRIIVYDRRTRSGFKLPPFNATPPVEAKQDNNLRIDMPPRWNRDGSKILFEAIDKDGTRQLFVVHLDEKPATGR